MEKVLRDVEQIDFHCDFSRLRMNSRKFSVPFLSTQIYQNKPMQHCGECFVECLECFVGGGETKNEGKDVS